jgi:hypothetical protein
VKFRGLLVAVAALAVLGGLAYWSEKKKAADAGKPSPDESPKVMTLPEDQFKEVRIEKEGAPPTVVAKNEAGNWQITQPQPLPADQDSVKSLVNTLSSVSSDRLIEEKAASLGEFGLDNPPLEAVVTMKDGKTHKLLLGGETPTGSGVFAKTEGDPRVFTVASWVKSSIDKGASDLRDKRLLTFDSDKLTRVELNAKGQPVEFGKNAANEWQIVKPRPLRADNSQVEDLVRQLKDARMELGAEDDAKKAASGFASGTRVGVAQVTDASGTQTIEVRRDKDKNYYAKSSVVDGVYKISSTLGEALDKGLENFRNKKLFDFGWSEPSKVEVKRDGQTVSYQKSGEKWTSGSKEMDSSTVQTLIDKLRDLSASTFVDSAGGAPVMEVTVTSNDGKRVETVTITKQGNSYYARRANEPSVYELDASTVEGLQTAAAGVKEPAAQAAQPAGKK